MRYNFQKSINIRKICIVFLILLLFVPTIVVFAQPTTHPNSSHQIHNDHDHNSNNATSNENQSQRTQNKSNSKSNSKKNAVTEKKLQTPPSSNKQTNQPNQEADNNNININNSNNKTTTNFNNSNDNINNDNINESAENVNPNKDANNDNIQVTQANPVEEEPLEQTPEPSQKVDSDDVGYVNKNKKESSTTVQSNIAESQDNLNETTADQSEKLEKPEDLPDVDVSEISFPEVIPSTVKQDNVKHNYVAGIIAWCCILIGIIIVIFVMVKGKKSSGDVPVQNISAKKQSKKRKKGRHLLPDKYYRDDF